MPRPHLVKRLNEGLPRQSSDFARKLTLISAPAGFGKTTLVADWVVQIKPGIGVAWLSLDVNDNEVSRFLTYLVAALQTVDGSLGNAVVSFLGSRRPPPPEKLITLLVNDLAALSGRAVLVLDDYYVISHLEIYKALTFLLDNLPPQAHLIIVSREDPLLPLHRLRGRGQVAGRDSRQGTALFKG